MNKVTGGVLLISYLCFLISFPCFLFLCLSSTPLECEKWMQGKKMRGEESEEILFVNWNIFDHSSGTSNRHQLC